MTLLSMILLDSPNLIKAMSIDSSHHYNIPFQFYNDTHIFFIQGGRGEFTIDGHTFTAGEGDFIVCHPGISYAASSFNNDPLKAIFMAISNIHISDKTKGYIIDEGAPPLFRLHKNRMIIEKLMLDIVSEFKEPQLGSTEMITALLRSLIVHLIRSLTVEEVSSYSSASQTVKSYIEQNYKLDLSLSDLASIVYVSPYHLAHLFKNETGMSPIQYLIQCRIEEAKRLLKYTDLSVREISASVGYPNANYFNLLFKKMTGNSPGKYRRH